MTDPYVRPDVKAFLDFLANVSAPKLHDMPLVDARASFGAMNHLAELPAGDLAVKRDLATPDGVGLRVYDARERREPGPVLVFFHGGGFVIGDLDSHDSFCAEAARALDLPVIAVDYRLAPEHRFPAATDDCEAAARWIATAPEALGVKPTGLAFAGDSAGGNLTIVTTQALRDRPAAVPVIAQWPIYPTVDDAGGYASFTHFADGYLLTADAMRWFSKAYAASEGDVRTAPIHADHAGTPPTLVLTAGLDPLRDQGRAYAARLVEAGVTTVFREAAGNIHGFINLRKAIPSSIGDLAPCFAIFKDMIVEAEAARVMSQAASGAA